MLVDIARQLSRHIAVLKAQHRSGVTPTYGQVEDLFDLGEELGVAAAVFEASRQTAPLCVRRGCEAVASEIVGKHRYCQACAARVRELAEELRAIGPELAAELIRVDWPTPTAERSAS